MGKKYHAMKRLNDKEKLMTIKDNELLWAKVKPNAIIPTKRAEDAGYDIYPCFDEIYTVILPHETKLIPTGIASAFSDDYVAVLKERGSTGTRGIAQRCGVLDSGFRNEWFTPITNTTDKTIIISKYSLEELIDKYAYESPDGDIYLEGDEHTSIYLKYKYHCGDEVCMVDAPIIVYPYFKAICQALLLPVPKMSVSEVSYEELKLVSSERGLGMLGSSNK